MSDATSQTIAVEALSKQIEAIERDSAGLATALANARNARRWLLLAVVVFIAVAGWAFYRLGKRIQSEEHVDLLVEAAEEQLGQRSDYFVRELQTLADNSGPVLRDAFYAQAKKDLPSFLQGMEQQRDQLVANLEVRFEEKLETHHANVLARHEKILKEEFPLVEDSELHARMMANIETALQKLSKKYFVDELREQMEALFSILDQFPAAEPAAEGEVPLEDQIVGNMLELLAVKLTGPAPEIEP